MALPIITVGYHGEYTPKQQDITSNSLVTLVSAVSGKSVKVFAFQLSSNSVSPFWLNSGANRLQTFFMSANSISPFMQSVDNKHPIFVSNLGEALTFQASDAFIGKASVYLQYKVEA